MIQLRDIRKRFGPVAALDGVHLDLASHEIHALLGENGAGKTTLMKILFGLLRPDAGDVLVDGRAVVLRRPADARQIGIAMVHQHFMLVEHMTVAENVLLGDRFAPRWLSAAVMQRVVARDAERLGLDIDAAARVESLSVGQRQRVELLKVLRRPARALILDEPTAVLTPSEADALFDTLRILRGGGCTVVFISHKLAEIERLCDRVTVLRHGRTVFSGRVAESSPASLAAHMIGRAVPAAKSRAPMAAGEVVLRHDRLSLRAGEIVGIAGVEGNGQAALVHDLLRHARGRVGHIPDDRQREALVPGLSVSENAVLKDHALAPFSRRGRLHWPAIRTHARNLIDRYGIKARSEGSAVADLSGGNQQKLIVARELHAEPRQVFAINPTRGLDIAATQFVHEQLLARRAAGAAVLLVSSDLDEVLALSDRVLVIYRSRLSAVDRPEKSLDLIARKMAGLE